MADGLKNILKNISKKYGENVVKTGVESLEVDGILPLGSPRADFALYGGIPEGRIVELSGAEGSGKTTITFLIAAQYQRIELERNPDSPRAIILLDNEGTADPVWAKVLGYDINFKADKKDRWNTTVTLPITADTPDGTEYIYQDFYRKQEKEMSLHETRWETKKEDRIYIEFGEHLKEIIAEVRKNKTEHQMSMKDSIPELIIACPKRFRELYRKSEKDIKACTGAENLIIRT